MSPSVLCHSSNLFAFIFLVVREKVNATIHSPSILLAHLLTERGPVCCSMEFSTGRTDVNIRVIQLILFRDFVYILIISNLFQIENKVNISKLSGLFSKRLHNIPVEIKIAGDKNNKVIS